jgi:streptogramin lyase
MWFVDVIRKLVGRVTPTGEITQFSLPAVTGGAQTIASGPDGNLWLTTNGGGQGQPDWILRVSVRGDVTKFQAGSNPSAGFGTGPESITAGPDGNLWFTEFWTNRVGRLSPAGTLTEFSIPTVDSAPRGIVSGPDGNVWFVESTRTRPAIARITTKGVITEYPITSGPSDLYPNDIITGPDGKLWFTEQAGIAHISTGGEIVPVSLPTGSQPMHLVAGPDGNMWFSDWKKNSIVRLSVSGSIRQFLLPRRGSSPLGMALGADGRIWFGETGYPAIASIGIRVPEVLMSMRPQVFNDSSWQTVSLRNIGEAPLAISGVRITGVDAKLFVKGNDTCAGAPLAPDASCNIELKHVAGGSVGLQSALLELADNATGSPQRLSLLAQVPQCSLPVTSGGDANSPPQGEQLDVRSGRVLYDAYGGFERGSAASGVRTMAPPGLSGPAAGYFDRAVGRWLPVESADAVSPDGSRYAYVALDQGPRSEVRLVDITSGSQKLITIRPDFWRVVAFRQQGIYLHTGYEGVGAGLWLLDPDTGALKTVFTDAQVTVVDETDAWLMMRNPSDKLPDPSAMGASSDEILRRDLLTGATTVWLYRPGTSMGVVAVANRMPIVWIYDGLSTTYWIMTRANEAQRMDFPFSSVRYPSIGGFTGDAAGVWAGSLDGVYLWTPRTGGVLMSEVEATPAGICA